MSSRVSRGWSARIASTFMPAPSFRSTVSTGMRVPRITGLPVMISGLISIRSCVIRLSFSPWLFPPYARVGTQRATRAALPSRIAAQYGLRAIAPYPLLPHVLADELDHAGEHVAGLGEVGRAAGGALAAG